MMDSENEIRKQLSKLVGAPISEPMWDYLVSKRYVSEVSQGLSAIETLRSEMDNLTRASGGFQHEPGEFVAATKRQRRGKKNGAQLDAESCFIAADARANPHVIHFRATYLKTGLLSSERVHDWIQENIDNGVTSTLAISVKLPRGVKLILKKWRQVLSSPVSIESPAIEHMMPDDYLEYQFPGERYVRIVPVGRDGVLRELYTLSSSLAKSYGWKLDQATMFVFTDRVPRLPPIRCEIQPRYPLECLTRISISASLSATPREVMFEYARLRSKCLNLRPGTKLRRLSDKHSHLAMFALDHKTLGSAELKMWNDRFPKWSYYRSNRFRKEAGAAKHRQQRLLRRFYVGYFEVMKAFS
jgi:hypothetical protein